MIAQLSQGQRQQVRLRREDKVLNVQQQVRRVGKQQVQILERFREDVRIHAVLVLASTDVVDGCVTTGYAGMLLEGLQSFLPNLNGNKKNVTLL